MKGGQQTVPVAHGSGFIGGPIAATFSKLDVRVQAVDIRHLDQWHQICNGVDRLPEGTLLLDPWNAAGVGRVFGLVHERAGVE